MYKPGVFILCLHWAFLTLIFPLNCRSISKSWKVPCFWHQDPAWCFPAPPLHGLHQCEAGLRFTPQRPPWTTNLEKNSATSPPPSPPFAYSSDFVSIFKSFSKEKVKEVFWNKSWDSSVYPLSPNGAGWAAASGFSGQQCQLCCHSCFFQQPQPSCCGMRAGLGEEGRFPFMSQQNLALPGWGENSLRWRGWEPRWGRCP